MIPRRQARRSRFNPALYRKTERYEKNRPLRQALPQRSWFLCLYSARPAFCAADMRVRTREGSYPPASPRRREERPAGLAGSLRWDGGFSASNGAPSFAVFVFSRALVRLADDCAGACQGKRFGGSMDLYRQKEWLFYSVAVGFRYIEGMAFRIARSNRIARSDGCSPAPADGYRPRARGSISRPQGRRPPGTGGRRPCGRQALL